MATVFMLLSLRPQLLTLTDLLVGAFARLVATGRRPLVCVACTPEGLGIGPAALCTTLRGLYGSHYAPMWRSPRVHWSRLGSVDTMSVWVAALWDCAPVPLRRGASWVPSAWTERPEDRVILFSGWLEGVSAGEGGHWMGLAWDGRVLCSRFGPERAEDIRGAALEVLRRVRMCSRLGFWSSRLRIGLGDGRGPRHLRLRPHAGIGVWVSDGSTSWHVR